MINSYTNNISSSDPDVIMRKTYSLLAITMIPSVIGVMVGMKLGIMGAIIGSIGAIGFFIASLVLMIAITYGISKAGDTPMGIGLLMTLTFILGMFLSSSVERVLKIPNGSVLVASALIGTGGIFAGMAILNNFLGRDLSFLGKGLFIALIALLIGSFLFIFFPSGLLYILLTVATLILFSVYLLYDLNRIMMGGETSYVRATLDIYLDLFNIFRSLLSLLGIFGNDD